MFCIIYICSRNRLSNPSDPKFVVVKRLPPSDESSTPSIDKRHSPSVSGDVKTALVKAFRRVFTRSPRRNGMPKMHYLLDVLSDVQIKSSSRADILEFGYRNGNGLRVAMADADIHTLDPGFGSCSFGVTV